jgi:hypothetical protein
MGAVEHGKPSCLEGREAAGFAACPLLIRDLAAAEIASSRAIFDASKGADHGYLPAGFAVP